MFNMKGKETHSFYSIMLSIVSFRGKLIVYEWKETNLKYFIHVAIFFIYHDYLVELMEIPWLQSECYSTVAEKPLHVSKVSLPNKI